MSADFDNMGDDDDDDVRVEVGVGYVTIDLSAIKTNQMTPKESVRLGRILIACGNMAALLDRTKRPNEAHPKLPAECELPVCSKPGELYLRCAEHAPKKDDG